MRGRFRPVRYLAENYPECGGIEALDPYHDAEYEAAAREDWDGYVDALRNYIRAGRGATLAVEAIYIHRAVKKYGEAGSDGTRCYSSSGFGGAQRR